MLLAIDSGNTNVVCAVYEGDNLRGSWRAGTNPNRTADEYAVWLIQLMSLAELRPNDIDATIIGSVVPERANCELEKVAPVMFTETVPVFVTDTFCIVFLPTVTVPKLTFVGLRWNSAAIACCACLTMPAHPLNTVSAGINSNKAGRPLAMRYCSWTGFIFFPTVICDRGART